MDSGHSLSLPAWSEDTVGSHPNNVHIFKAENYSVVFLLIWFNESFAYISHQFFSIMQIVLIQVLLLFKFAPPNELFLGFFRLTPRLNV